MRHGDYPFNRGKRKVEGGKRKVEGGKWKVEGGKRKVEGGKWKEVTDCYDLVPFLCCLCARRCRLVVIWLQIDISPKI